MNIRDFLAAGYPSRRALWSCGPSRRVHVLEAYAPINTIMAINCGDIVTFENDITYLVETMTIDGEMWLVTWEGIEATA